MLEPISKPVGAAMQELKNLVEERGGLWESDPDYVSQAMLENFARNVLAHHQEGGPTLWDHLRRRNHEFPDPDLMSAETLARKLWELIKILSELGVYLQTTNHLSDRELYRRLYHEVLYDTHPVIDLKGVVHVNMLDFSKEGDMLAFYRYYLEDDEKDDWFDFFPDQPIPKTSKPPYDRDRLLPGAA